MILVVILLVLVMGVMGLALISSSAAAFESARAAEAAAQAAQMAVGVTLLDQVISLVAWLVVLAAVGVVGVFLWKREARSRLPVAGSQRRPSPPTPLPQERGEAQLAAGDPLDRLVTIMTVQMMQQIQRDAQRERASLPYGEER